MKKIVTIEDIRKAYIAAVVLSEFGFTNVENVDIHKIKDVYDANSNRDDNEEVDVDENIAKNITFYKDKNIVDYIAKTCKTGYTSFFSLTNDLMYDILTEIYDVATDEPDQAEYCEYAIKVIKAFLKTFVSVIRAPYDDPIITEFINVVDARVHGFSDSAKFIPYEAIDCKIIDDCINAGNVINDKGKINNDIIAKIADKHDASPEYVRDLIEGCRRDTYQGCSKPYYM